MIFPLIAWNNKQKMSEKHLYDFMKFCDYKSTYSVMIWSIEGDKTISLTDMQSCGKTNNWLAARKPHLAKGQSHYSDVIINTMASQITGLLIVCTAVCSGTDQRKHQSSASLAFVGGIHQWPVNSPHKGPVMRKMFPFDDAIMARMLNFKNQYSVYSFSIALKVAGILVTLLLRAETPAKLQSD